MPALIGEEVISGIAKKLSTNISALELKNIYKNKPQQGMVKPCAFLHQLDYGQTSEMRNRANRDYLVDIRVHPADDEQRIQSWGTKLAEKVISAVSTINIVEEVEEVTEPVEEQEEVTEPVKSDKPIRLKRAEWRIESDVLHVIVSYSFKVIQVIEDSTPYMETLDYTERVI